MCLSFVVCFEGEDASEKKRQPRHFDRVETEKNEVECDCQNLDGRC